MLWYRVDTSGMKWVASQDSLDSQKEAASQAMSLDCLHSILRTAWIETAPWSKQRRYCILVYPNNKNESGLQKFSGDPHILISC